MLTGIRIDLRFAVTCFFFLLAILICVDTRDDLNSVLGDVWSRLTRVIASCS